ncbi:hypothetical protein D7V86_01955 [bacterium D16-51]|nr:hypothetical protein D7V96_01380 [bacterium D16-59]RKI62304.1 hypothetical protein D7V86_01955 [bacterium D16-51]
MLLKDKYNLLMKGDRLVELLEITAEQYGQLCGEFQYFYNSQDFHELNRSKVDRVVYFLFKEKKNKLALASGLIDGVMKIPYSAPFSVFETMQKYIRIEEIDCVLRLLDEYAGENAVKKIIFRCPPIFYDTCFLSKLQNSMLRNGYYIAECDLNYQFHFDEKKPYLELLHRNAKKNLKRAMQHGLAFLHCSTEGEKQEAFQIIADNRKSKGYPLRMTFNQVLDTIQFTAHDFFILKLGDKGIASAIVFQVTSKCYQVIYWGNLKGTEDVRPMNYLAYCVYRYYEEKGIEFLDIGPSSEEGIPNYGLCDFKESIGCEVVTKYTYLKIIN